MNTPPLSALTRLSDQDEEALIALYQRGTPANTLRAWERDLSYIAAWKTATFEENLAWPETEHVALRFILDHTSDLGERPGPAQDVARHLIRLGLRKTLYSPAISTLERKIATWQAFHKMRNMASPFSAPLLRQARQKARRAMARPRKPKSPRPITRDILTTLLTSCDHSAKGLRDRAMLSLAFASGGRRRSEISALLREDIDTSEFEEKGYIWLQLHQTKTTGPDATPRLPVKGPAARALIYWIHYAAIRKGPLFRPISRSGRILERPLADDALRSILRNRLLAAGLPGDYATPHGLRSGFLTQAALDGAPLSAAIQLSLHKSVIQAQKYYADVEIIENPATDLLGD